MTYRERLEALERKVHYQDNHGGMEARDGLLTLARDLLTEIEADCTECSSPGVWEEMHDELAKLRKENAELQNELSWTVNPERMGR